MKINIEDLRVGDEIIIPSQSNLKYVKILSELKETSSTRYGSTKFIFKAVRCSIKTDKLVIPATKYHTQRIRNKYQFETNSSEHNARISLNLNYTDIWLVKREQF